MISLISFGLALMMAWALQRFAASFAAVMEPWRKKKISFGRAFLDPSLMSNQREVLSFQGLRLRTWKENLSWISLTGVSIWGALFVGVLFLEVNALLLFSVGLIAMLIPIPSRFWRGVAALFLFLGLALFAGENAVRFFGMMFGEDSNSLIWLLADGRAGPVVIWFLTGGLLGAVLEVEFLSFCLAIILVASGTMSISGAVALWLGDRVGWTLLLWWKSRALSTSTKKMISIKAVVTLGGSIVALLALGFARDLMGPVASIGVEGISERIGLFLVLSIFCELFPLISCVLLFKFRKSKTPEDLFESRYNGKNLLLPLLNRPWTLQVLREGILRRLQELKVLQKDFAAMDWQKVPPAIRQASEQEVQSLERLAAEAEALLLSRSSFFGEQLR